MRLFAKSHVIRDQSGFGHKDIALADSVPIRFFDAFAKRTVSIIRNRAILRSNGDPRTEERLPERFSLVIAHGAKVAVQIVGTAPLRKDFIIGFTGMQIGKDLSPIMVKGRKLIRLVFIELADEEFRCIGIKGNSLLILHSALGI